MSLAGMCVDTNKDWGYNAIWSYVKFPGDGIEPFFKSKANRPRGKGHVEKSTHFLLRGGVWTVPDQYMDKMLWHYAVSISQTRQTSIVERRTPLFRFHMDLDFKQLKEVSTEEVREYTIVFQETLRKFFPFADNLAFECTLNRSPTKEIHNKDASVPVLIKTGFHIIWIHLWVTEEQALIIRASIICFIQKKFKPRVEPLENLWEDVIDESIYIANGLRMVGAVKYHPCRCPHAREMKNSKRKLLEKVPGQEAATAATAPTVTQTSCGVCVEGYVFEGRAYWLEELWDFQCEPVDRLVRVYADKGPDYRPPHGYYGDRHVIYANAMPDWSSEEGTVAFKDLIWFGDGLAPLAHDEDPWQRVRKIHNTLRITSIRMPPEIIERFENDPDAIPQFIRYNLAPPAPSPADLQARLKHERKSKGKTDIKGRRFEILNEYKSVQKGQLCYVTDDELINDIERFIRTNCGVRLVKPYQPYAEVDVTNVLYNKPGVPNGIPRTYFVHLAGIGSAYCQNKQDDHHGHSIYFEIGPGPKRGGPKYVYQKCFCRCNVVRGDGKCMNYRKAQKELPAHLESRLFPKGSDERPDAVLAEKVLGPPVPFDAKLLLNDYGITVNDEDALEKRRRQKREREAKLGLPDPEKRMKSLMEPSDKAECPIEVNGPNDYFEY